MSSGVQHLFYRPRFEPERTEGRFRGNAAAKMAISARILATFRPRTHRKPFSWKRGKGMRHLSAFVAQVCGLFGASLLKPYSRRHPSACRADSWNGSAAFQQTCDKTMPVQVRFAAFLHLEAVQSPGPGANQGFLHLEVPVGQRGKPHRQKRPPATTGGRCKGKGG